MRVIFRKRGTSFFAKVIRLTTRGPYSHTELLFADNVSFSSDEADGGTRFKPWVPDPEQWDIVDVPVSPADEVRIRAFCEREKGRPYDWRGISFSFLPIPIGWQSQTKWFCSEVVTAGLQVAEYLIGFTPSALSPNDLYRELMKELPKDALSGR